MQNEHKYQRRKSEEGRGANKRNMKKRVSMKKSGKIDKRVSIWRDFMKTRKKVLKGELKPPKTLDRRSELILCSETSESRLRRMMRTIR